MTSTKQTTKIENKYFRFLPVDKTTKAPFFDFLDIWNQKNGYDAGYEWKAYAQAGDDSIYLITLDAIKKEENPVNMAFSLAIRKKVAYAIIPKASNVVVLDIEPGPESGKKKCSSRTFTQQELEPIIKKLIGIKPLMVYSSTSGGTHFVYESGLAASFTDKSIAVDHEEETIQIEVLSNKYAVYPHDINTFEGNLRKVSSDDTFTIEHSKALRGGPPPQKKAPQKKEGIQVDKNMKKLNNVEKQIKHALDIIKKSYKHVLEDYDTWNSLVVCASIASAKFSDGMVYSNDEVKKMIIEASKLSPKYEKGDVAKRWLPKKDAYSKENRHHCLRAIQKAAGMSFEEKFVIDKTVIDEIKDFIKDRFFLTGVGKDIVWMYYDENDTTWKIDESKQFATEVRDYIEKNYPDPRVTDIIQSQKGDTVIDDLKRNKDMYKHNIEFDTDPLIVNMPGKMVYNARTKQFEPGKPEMFLQRILTDAVDENDLKRAEEGDNMWYETIKLYQTPKHKKFEKEHDLRCKKLQEIEGGALVGTYSKKAYIYLGGGNNGKSCFVDIINYVLGSYAGEVSKGIIITKNEKYGDNPNALGTMMERLEGCRRASLDEPKGTFNETFKKLTGSPTISSPAKYRMERKYRNTARYFITCNTLPDIKDKGVSNRINVVPFEYTFKEIDDRWMERFLAVEENRKMAICWLISGLRNSLKTTLPDPKSWQIATNAYLDSVDVITGFISEYLTCVPGARSEKKDVYAAYQQYLRSIGNISEFSELNSEHKKELSADIADKFPDVFIKDRRAWVNLKMKSTEAMDINSGEKMSSMFNDRKQVSKLKSEDEEIDDYVKRI